jgi:large subunit ribosomal protein L9
MQLILTQDVDHLGKAGELVTVKPGYGRNYLLPRGLAVSATTRNVKKLEHDRGVIERRIAKQTAEAQGLAERIGGMTLQFERLVGEEEKLFGSVSSKDIASQLETAGIKVDHRKISLAEPVKALGKYEVDVKLGAGVKASLKFWVVGKEKDE